MWRCCCHVPLSHSSTHIFLLYIHIVLCCVLCVFVASVEFQMHKICLSYADQTKPIVYLFGEKKRGAPIMWRSIVGKSSGNSNNNSASLYFFFIQQPIFSIFSIFFMILFFLLVDFDRAFWLVLPQHNRIMMNEQFVIR